MQNEQHLYVNVIHLPESVWELGLTLKPVQEHLDTLKLEGTDFAHHRSHRLEYNFSGP